MTGAVEGDWRKVREGILRRDKFKCVECETPCSRGDADIHHLLPRSAGGTDEPSNLVTLCDGCHAAHHPKLAAGLGRRAIERWAVRLARWLDRRGEVPEEGQNFGPALRLFGLDRFRDGQLAVIQAALAGRSILVVSPTGFGKTLCFQLPAVLRRQVSVVVSPLKALMGEQVSALLRRKIPSSFINSDIDVDEKRLRYRLLASDHIKLLYAAPERFFVRNLNEQQLLRSLRPAFLVIDEAHCVDQWGVDFRPEYGRLKEVREALGSPPVLAFTATAGQDMQERILKSLGIPDAQVFVRGVDRPNIALCRWSVAVDERPGVIAQLCRVRMPSRGKVMIFVPTRKIGEALQKHLSEQGLRTPFYHSQLGDAWKREQLLKRFSGESRPEVDRIICTSAFGMGLDIKNVRLVIHWQHPSSIEDYLQEFGRAGRDGKASVAVLLHDRSNTRRGIGLLQFMADRAVGNAQLSPAEALAASNHKATQIDRMARLTTCQGCFREALVGYFTGPRRAVRRSFSTWLLELVFADRGVRQQRADCCDSCQQRLISRQGPLAFVSKVLCD
ncbi:RecQ family ATP-dependent DNA helicase [Bradyrhizobium sp. CCGB12]|uniref:RecQ family ATP-dependent DNA helicase n=1 Tax=Bradyrhizobium sp. CCGB12 TaxID=2949632 RepID=UPI0020B1901D|nr:RecQ family ATP-dependent DNA helicase [Bradyrhizobium sp. CCGB12]MCP3393900.1 RecQ family ATP-dependent DNA helicase [Bradyrhizobium sp. CCGB12]